MKNEKLNRSIEKLNNLLERTKDISAKVDGLKNEIETNETQEIVNNIESIKKTINNEIDQIHQNAEIGSEKEWTMKINGLFEKIDKISNDVEHLIDSALNIKEPFTFSGVGDYNQSALNKGQINYNDVFVDQHVKNSQSIKAETSQLNKAKAEHEKYSDILNKIKEKEIDESIDNIPKTNNTSMRSVGLFEQMLKKAIDTSGDFLKNALNTSYLQNQPLDVLISQNICNIKKLNSLTNKPNKIMDYKDEITSLAIKVQRTNNVITGKINGEKSKKGISETKKCIPKINELLATCEKSKSSFNICERLNSKIDLNFSVDALKNSFENFKKMLTNIASKINSPSR